MMKKQENQLWDELRSRYRSRVPELDTAAIMEAVRREAATTALRPGTPNPVAAVPTWACAVAAALALLATVAVAARSITVADEQINQALSQDVEPEEFAREFLSFGEFTL